jgi:hypothetical protein
MTEISELIVARKQKEKQEGARVPISPSRAGPSELTSFH